MKTGGIPVHGSATCRCYARAYPEGAGRNDGLLSDQRKNNVESVFAVNGFGFAGRGQNTGIAFVSLKDWSERPGDENKVEAITARAMGAFSKIKDAMVFAFNLPAIVELGTATGFDFQLIDQVVWAMTN